MICLLVIAALCLITCLPLCAETSQERQENQGKTDVAAWATSVADDILAAQVAIAGVKDLQEWADSVLPDLVGVGGEWYAIALHQRDSTLSLDAYSRALQIFLRDRQGGEDNAVVCQRYALALLATGGGDRYLSYVSSIPIGTLGHMNYVYGLHLVHNGMNFAMDESTILTYLLQAQAEDGGWSLAGHDAASDVDVTAMTLQALAPYRDTSAVASAAESAWDFLSAAQTENGDFYSYGTTCPESGAQVILALCAWDLPVDDARFVKNHHTLLDGILQYRLDSGSFSHVLGGDENTTATLQVLCAAVAIERAAGGRAPFYTIDPVSSTDRSDLTAPVEIDDGTVLLDFSQMGVKNIIVLSILVVALLACFVLLMRGKRGAKHYLSVALLAALALLAVWLMDIQTPEQYYHATEKDDAIGSVTLTICCHTVAGEPGTEHLPADGVILEETTIPLSEGETVFDILTQAAAAYHLRVVHTGVTAASSKLAYISSINDLSEYDFGDLSGWVYFVNEISPSVGCGNYVLSPGDRIEFAYTCNLGKDVTPTPAQ